MRFPIGRKVLYSTLLNKFKAKASLNTESKSASLHHSVSHEEMCHLYSAHSLSLNIAELRDTYVLKQPIPKIHLRAFEFLCVADFSSLRIMKKLPDILKKTRK